MTGSALRVATIAVCAVTLAAGSPHDLPGAPVGAGSVTAPRYVAPLPDPVVVLRPFAPPATEFGAGHLGVDLRAAPGAVVRAAAVGVIEFAGQVAGRGVVVIGHPDGVRTEYEPVRPLVRPGTRVRAGDPIGVLDGRHAGCGVACLHWGARRANAYLDPLALLRPLGPVVLLPDAAATH